MTTYTFDRGAQYGDAEFLGNIDCGCEDLTSEQMEMVRDAYVQRVHALIEAYDPTLIWQPSLSEVWGIEDRTEADPAEFREWWKAGNEDGRWEAAFLAAYDEVTEGGSGATRTYGDEKTHLTLTAKAQQAYDQTDPLKIIEHEDGTYSLRGIEDRDGMTAADVNEWLENLADETMEERTVADILREVGADAGEAFDVFEISVDADLPRSIEQYAEAYNAAIEPIAADILPDSTSRTIRGDYAAREISFEEFNRFFCADAAPADLAESFPRIMIAVYPQKEAPHEI